MRPIMLLGKRGARCVAVSARRETPNGNGILRASRIVFVTGPFTHIMMWRSVQSTLVREGFDTTVVSFDGAETATQLADALARHVHGGFPPILIGHSLGAAIIARYLESFPAERVVFVNPLCTSASLGRIRAPNGGSISALLRDASFVRKLAGDDEQLVDILPGLARGKFGQSVIDELLKEPPKFDADTNVPTYLVYSACDPLVTAEDATKVGDTYAVHDDDVLKLPGGHLSLLRQDEAAFTERLLKWVD